MKVTQFDLFEKYAVTDCETLLDFINRYRRVDRFTERDKYMPGYSKAIIKTHQDEFEKHGIAWIGNHESNTGKIVSFIKK